MLVTNAALVVVLTCAVWMDVRTRRIPNVLIAVGLILAMAVSGWESGWASVGGRLVAGLLGLLLLFPLFLVRAVGAGDVKLMAVVGAHVGMSALWPVIFYTLLAGGVVGAIGFAYAHMKTTTVASMRTTVLAGVAHLRGLPSSRKEHEHGGSVRVPYSIAIAAGVIFWLVVNQ